MFGTSATFIITHSMLYLICLASLLSLTKSSISRNYVVPSGNHSMCSSSQLPCYTLEEYASHFNTYFVNNTAFYFYPGTLRLDVNLTLTKLTNVSMIGLSENEVVSITLDYSVSVTCMETLFKYRNLIICYKLHKQLYLRYCV